MCASDRFFRLPLAAMLAAAMLAVAPVHAAEKKADPDKQQLRRMQQAQKRLEQEKSVLAGELDAEKKKVEEEAARAESMAAEAGSLRAARDATKAKLASTETKLKEAQAELARAKEQSEAQQRQAAAEKKKLEQELTAGRQQYATCVQRDQELRKTSATVLELYEKKTCADGFLQNEPFTGLKRVEIENNVEDLREKLEAPGAG